MIIEVRYQKGKEKLVVFSLNGQLATLSNFNCMLVITLVSNKSDEEKEEFLKLALDRFKEL